MSARERILAVVEFVRGGQGGYDAAARKFRMTRDVVKKACAAAGVNDIAPAPQPGRAPPQLKKDWLFTPNATERERQALSARRRERWTEKRVTKDMVKD